MHLRFPRFLRLSSLGFRITGCSFGGETYMALRHLALLTLASLAVMANAQYDQSNLVSDGSIPAAFTDPLLANPWGLAASSTSPIWIADEASNYSTLYHSNGSPISLQVNVPG